MEKFCCIICDNKNFYLENSSIRNDTSGIFKILKCNNCNLVQLYPNDYNKKEYYDDDRQVKDIMKVNNRSYLDFNNMIKYQAKNRLEILENNFVINDDVNIIDIGSGTGEFIKEINNKFPNIEKYLLEPGTGRIENIEDQNGIKKINKLLDNDFSFKNIEKFDIVTTFHVLEHVEKPLEFVENCYRMVKPGGILYIEVPNQDNELLELSDYYKNKIWYCQSHISYFNKDTIKYIFDKIGINNYSIHACERYDYENYKYWVENNKPQPKCSFYKGFPINEEERIWIENRKITMKSDSFYVLIYK